MTMNKQDLQSLKATNEALKAKGGEIQYQKKAKGLADIDDVVEQLHALFIEIQENLLEEFEINEETDPLIQTYRTEVTNFSKHYTASCYRQQGGIFHFAKAMKPDPELTVSEWADKHRMLSTKASSSPGPWDTNRTPYLREIMDSLSATSDVESVVLMKGAQVGGPLALDTPIATINGWTTMGKIKEGDWVFDEAGQQCQVISTSPIFYQRPCYRVYFSDHQSIVTDESHRWWIWDEKNYRYRKERIATTGEIKETYKVGNRNRYAVDVCKPLTLPQQKLPIHPYVFGYWLGNGNAIMNQLTLHEDDTEIADHLNQCDVHAYLRMPKWRKGKTGNIVLDPTIRTKDDQGNAVAKNHRSRFMEDLRSLNMIGNKHIPPLYLRASLEQRLELIQGLMDSDGNISEGRCEFSSAIPRLRDDFLELAWSLGLKPTVYTRAEKQHPINGRMVHSNMCWRVSFTCYCDRPVFKLSRKLERLPDREGKRTTETERRRIVGVESVPSVPVRCIGVDSPSHLYLAGQAMIPTHNTEAGNNWLGYVIHHVPGPMLYVMPTVEAVKRTSKQRIATMIEDTPVVRERVTEPRAKDSGNTILSKEFPGGTLIMTGANSAVGLRSMPARYLFLDEVDAYPVDVNNEGDPINLAIKRTQTFNKKRKIFMVSTPTIKDISRIERAFLDSDQRSYHLPCPYCGAKQVIFWSQIRWHENDPKTAHCVCKHCHGEIQEHHKESMLLNGEWIAENPDSNVAGFHLSGLYSPSEWYPWSECVEEYLVAKEDPALLKTWVNTALGETWDEPGTQVDSNMLYYRREEYKAEVPKGGIVITAGVDVQGDRLEAEAVAWNEKKESWSIDYQIFFGDPDQDDVWNQLEEWLTREWKHETGHRLRIQCACIDSGGHHTQRVYAFCKSRTRRKVYAIKGVGGAGRPIASSPSQKRTGRESRPVPLFTIGVDTAKEVLYSRLLKTEEGPGYCHFPNNEPPYSEQFFEQLTAEKLVTKTVKGNPKRVWELAGGRRNEVLDCRVYAMAGLELLRPDFEGWRKHLATEAMTDKQREYEEHRKQLFEKWKPKKPRVVTSPWMADVLGGPAGYT